MIRIEVLGPIMQQLIIIRIPPNGIGHYLAVSEIGDPNIVP